MKSLLRISTIVTALIATLCISANAAITLKEGVLFFSGENFNNYVSSGYVHNYSESMIPHSDSWAFNDTSLVCTNGDNWHYCSNTGYYRRSVSESRVYFPGFNIDGTFYLTDCAGNLGNVSSNLIYYSRPINYTTTKLQSAKCDRCNRVVTFTSPPSVYIWDKSTGSGSTYVYTFMGTTIYTSVLIKNCTSAGNYPATSNAPSHTFTLSSRPTLVNGGSYTGQPAFASSNVTIVKGTITDINSTTSTFLLGDDSEATVTTSGTKTV